MNIDPERTCYWIGEINAAHMKEITARIIELDHKNHEQPILLIVSSDGGSRGQSLAFFDLMRLLKPNLITIATGGVHSAAFIVWLAGVQRFVTPHCCMLFHQGRRSESKGPMIASDLQAFVRLHEVTEKAEQAIVASVSGSDNVAKRVAHLCDTGAVLEPKELVLLGLAHGILEVNA